MQGHRVCETPYDTLRALPAFILRNGEPVPTMDAFLAACSQALKSQQQSKRQRRLFFEVKPLESSVQRCHLIGQIIEAIGKHQLHDEVFFISFDLDACVMLSQLMPDVPVAYLEGDLSPKQLKDKGITDIDYHWSKFDAHPEWVKEAHDLGMTVNVWTVNAPEKAKEMLQSIYNEAFGEAKFSKCVPVNLLEKSSSCTTIYELRDKLLDEHGEWAYFDKKNLFNP
jgi:glycerophosphoryl diester phosphodiesterase